MSRKKSLPADRRAVSVTITHVLTIGITTILISGLLIGTGTLLDSQKDRATFSEKSTVGDRLASEITSVDQAAQQDPDGNITVRTEHPRQLSGGQYFVTLYDDEGKSEEDEDCIWDPEKCLVFESGQTENPVHVPLTIDSSVEDGQTVQGGEIWIHYDHEDDEIELRSDRP